METVPTLQYSFSPTIIHITLIHAKPFIINLKTYYSI